MPVYEYECQSCKFYMEVMQKITDAPLAKCPSCGKSALKKLLSAPVFRLKGGGWYETDFKSDKETKRNLAGADKEESKAEAKPEAKEAKPAEAPTPAAVPAEPKRKSVAVSAGKPAVRSASSKPKGKPARATRAKRARKGRRS
ncbi:MAG: zinc ribbon domain-containing protein [Gammaproteobacteria bacterium]|nr:MAG: zinc ribbon domain-containing protein [Gammaproteobacteria bacterium]